MCDLADRADTHTELLEGIEYDCNSPGGKMYEAALYRFHGVVERTTFDVYGEPVGTEVDHCKISKACLTARFAAHMLTRKDFMDGIDRASLHRFHFEAAAIVYDLYADLYGHKLLWEYEWPDVEMEPDRNGMKPLFNMIHHPMHRMGQSYFGLYDSVASTLDGYDESFHRLLQNYMVEYGKMLPKEKG